MSTEQLTQCARNVLDAWSEAGWNVGFDAAMRAMREALADHPAPQPQQAEREPSPTAGMTLAQRILHVGGRNNAAGYVEFGSTQAVEALVRQVLRDLPAAPQPTAPADGYKFLEDGKTMIPKGWTWCRIEHEPGYPEDVAFGPVVLMERLKWQLDRYYAVKLAAPAPANDDQSTWCGYIAGMIGTYLRWPVDDARLEAVAGIIARRLYLLPVPAQSKPRPEPL